MDVPRRSNFNQMSPAERAIFDAMQEVEEVGADERLTDAVIMLQHARDKVADYIDSLDPDEQNKHLGLYEKYIIQKANGEPVDDNAKYFVLRYDENGSDPVHIAACRKAMATYSIEIKDHLPLLYKDIRREIGNIEPSATVSNEKYLQLQTQVLMDVVRWAGLQWIYDDKLHVLSVTKDGKEIYFSKVSHDEPEALGMMLAHFIRTKLIRTDLSPDDPMNLHQ